LKCFSNDVSVQRSSIVFNQQLRSWTSDLNVPHCVYLWNKYSAVCRARNPDGSCSFTVTQAAEKLTRSFESLCGNVCVQREKSQAECSASVWVSFQPVGHDISWGEGSWSSPDAGLEEEPVGISPARDTPEERGREVPQMRTWRRWWPISLHDGAERLQVVCCKALNRLNTTLELYCWHTPGPEVNTLALRLRQLRVSRRTRVHWECRGETAIINTVWYGSYTLLTLDMLSGVWFL